VSELPALLELTPHQREAVAHEGSRVLLVASAGSGKTEVLTRRVIRHLEESPGNTFRILAVTFTVRAAAELRDRIKESVAHDAWRVDSQTVHGFALDWLMRFGQVVNVFPDTVVYSEDADRLQLLRGYVNSMGETEAIDLRPVLNAIDDHRTSGREEDDLERVGLRIGSLDFNEIFHGYLSAMEAANGIDFPGMLTKFAEAAALDLRFLENFWSTFRYVLVDEGQDLSVAQTRVLEHLASQSVGLFVVADDRQSINGFAGGAFNNVRPLVGEVAFASPLQLLHNFRCSTEVMAVAENLAAHLRNKPSSSLAAENAPPGAVALVPCQTPADEATAAARWVESLLNDGLDRATLSEGEDPSVRPEDVAVIARARWLLDPVLAEFDAAGVEVSVQTDAQSLLKTPTGRIFMEGLALVANGSDAPARRRLTDELRGLGVEVEADEATVVDLLRESGLSDLDPVADALESVDANSLPERLNMLQESADWSDWLSDLQVIRTSWANYAVEVSHHLRDLTAFTRFMLLALQARPSDPGVRALTIHKVKGLEFKAVCLIGAYAGALPDYRATSAEQVDEERRAFYVAVTRAARSLLITYPTLTTDRYGRTHRQEPSLFVREAGLI